MKKLRGFVIIVRGVFYFQIHNPEEILMKYDYLVVGAGLFGAVFAHEMNKKGKSVLVIDKRDHVGGNIYTENRMGINVHK
jgi:NADPH-dependent 2,4-dienoyl-CoA reductase/sulfur reductase-like enzyme